MPVVLDSSIAMALVMEDEDLPNEVAFLEQLATEGGVVPPYWGIELANSLFSAARRRRLPAEQCRVRFALARSLPIDVNEAEVGQALERTIDVALANGLTAYDAAHLELAVRLDLPLATLDRKLARAAVEEGVEVIGVDPA